MKIKSPIPIHFLVFIVVVAFYFFYSITIYTKAANKGSELNLSEIAQHGQTVFQENNCISCHQIYGLGGYMGPDLTNIISAKGKGAPFAKALIKGGSLKMPNFKLPDSDIDALIEYLTYIDSTGKFPIKQEDIAFQWYGTVEIN